MEHPALLGAKDVFQLKERHFFRPQIEHDEGNTGQPGSTKYRCES